MVYTVFWKRHLINQNLCFENVSKLVSSKDLLEDKQRTLQQNYQYNLIPTKILDVLP